MNRMKLIKEMVKITDTPAFYESAKRLGEMAALITELKKTQITNLETIANSTLKVSDIKDYVKKQTGKHKEWQQKFDGEEFGTKLLDKLNELTNERDGIVNALGVSDNNEKREIYLYVVREFIKHFVIHFEYKGGGS